MSTDYHTSVGPFVVCKTHKSTTTDSKRTCSNANCKRYENSVWDMKIKFCHECGAQILERDYFVPKDSVDKDELHEGALKQRLRPPSGDGLRHTMDEKNIHIWLSNVKDNSPDAPLSFNFKYQDSMFCPIEVEIIKKQKENFAKQFEAELDILKKAYGEENVSIHWGLIHDLW